MRAAMSDFDQRTAAGQIQMFDQDEWYAKQESMNTAEKVQSWLSCKDEALGSGYAGLRSTGNTSFLDEGAWNEFLIYERAVNEAFRDQPITGLCSYRMDRCSAEGVVDVLHCHGFGLTKRHGHWDLIEVRDHDRESSEVYECEHGSLATSVWPELRWLIEDQLAVFIGAYPERIALQGGQVRVSASQATELAVLFNELANNAAKHGALSAPGGRILVQWRIAANGSRRLQITWAERGMSGLTVPDKLGSGTRVLARLVENCVRVYDHAGMTCTFELNLESE